MVTEDAIKAIINPRLNRTLWFAQLAMPDEKFQVFRKLLLDEFGKRGLEGDLDRLLGSASEQER
jgi:hypothetical protein